MSTQHELCYLDHALIKDFLGCAFEPLSNAPPAGRRKEKEKKRVKGKKSAFGGQFGGGEKDGEEVDGVETVKAVMPASTDLRNRDPMLPLDTPVTAGLRLQVSLDEL